MREPKALAWVRERLDADEPPRGPWRARFTSPVHSTRVAAILGLSLGISFFVCFATGLLSHAYQAGVTLPSRPVDLYRFTQGLHVITGLVSVPLLLAKLVSVYPRFWDWPLVRGPLHALERLALGVLVGGALFQLTSGVFNVAGWYAFDFFFTQAHYWVAWATIGALLVHIGAKLTLIRTGLGRTGSDPLAEELAARAAAAPSGAGADPTTRSAEETHEQR